MSSQRRRRFKETCPKLAGARYSTYSHFNIKQLVYLGHFYSPTKLNFLLESDERNQLEQVDKSILGASDFRFEPDFWAFVEHVPMKIRPSITLEYLEHIAGIQAHSELRQRLKGLLEPNEPQKVDTTSTISTTCASASEHDAPNILEPAVPDTSATTTIKKRTLPDADVFEDNVPAKRTLAQVHSSLDCSALKAQLRVWPPQPCAPYVLYQGKPSHLVGHSVREWAISTAVYMPQREVHDALLVILTHSEVGSDVETIGKRWITEGRSKSGEAAGKLVQIFGDELFQSFSSTEETKYLPRQGVVLARPVTDKWLIMLPLRTEEALKAASNIVDS